MRRQKEKRLNKGGKKGMEESGKRQKLCKKKFYIKEFETKQRRR
jgi:hypothetical protein